MKFVNFEFQMIFYCTYEWVVTFIKYKNKIDLLFQWVGQVLTPDSRKPCIEGAHTYVPE